VLEARGRVIDGGIGIDFAQAGEGIEFLGRSLAFQANVARGEELDPTVGTNFAYQSISLLIQTPMT